MIDLDAFLEAAVADARRMPDTTLAAALVASVRARAASSAGGDHDVAAMHNQLVTAAAKVQRERRALADQVDDAVTESLGIVVVRPLTAAELEEPGE